MGNKILKLVNDARWTDALVVNNRLNEITFDPMRSQEEFVIRLIRENAKTAYGMEKGFSGITSLQAFRERIPLTSYEDYAPYIKRIAEGEQNVLTAYMTEHFSLLSGYKKLPISKWDAQVAYALPTISSKAVASSLLMLKEPKTFVTLWMRITSAHSSYHCYGPSCIASWSSMLIN